MNLTYNGIRRLEESILITDETDAVARARHAYEDGGMALDRTNCHLLLTPNEIVPSQLEGELARLLDTLRVRLERPTQGRCSRPRPRGRHAGMPSRPRIVTGDFSARKFNAGSSRPLDHGPESMCRGRRRILVDQAALELVPAGTVIRVDVARGWVEQVRRNVESSTNVWAIEPDRGVDHPRPVGRILRQFYESLVGNDRAQAEAALDELRGRALLSATNLRFLRVEFLSSLGSPQELRDDPLLQDISLLARPPAVTESLAEAADALLVTPALDLQAKGELRSAAERLDVAWPALVTQAYQVTTSATARCYALGNCCLKGPRSNNYGNCRCATQATQSSLECLRRPFSSSRLRAVRDSDEPVLRRGLQSGTGDAATQVPDRSFAAIALAAAVNLQDSASAVRALAA